MNGRCFDRGAAPRGLRNTAVVIGCLLLTACPAAAPPPNWVKSGADAAATSQAAAGCRDQADAALAKEQGINEDISATLGRNWQLGGTTAVADQSMRQQAAADADQVFDGCMRAKGFKKAG